ncbi:MAG: glycosyl hydrolase family 18 protein [Oscillospiraceae bacterium]|nr:glycosyl hydrolase family 18 protein [Oscillospiraceae bacterium]
MSTERIIAILLSIGLLGGLLGFGIFSIATANTMRPGDSIELQLDEVQTFNNIVLREPGVAYGQPGNVRLFHIEAYLDGQWEKIYGSDVIGAFRMCVVDEVQASAIRLTIAETARRRRVQVPEMEVALQEPVERDAPFRVVGYFHPNVFIYDDIANYADQFDTVTHAIYIGNTQLFADEDGRPTLVRNAASPQNIADLQAAIGDRDVKLFVSLTCGERINGLNPLTDDPEDIARLAQQAFDIAMEHGLAGVEVNFEGTWANSRAHRAGYSMLIEQLGSMLHEVGKQIMVSVIPSYRFTVQALETLDYINIMTYDHSDTEQVWHSTYNAMLRDIYLLAVRGVPLIDAQGNNLTCACAHMPFPRERLNGGVPFYGMGNLGGVREWNRTFSFQHIYRQADGDFNPHANYCFVTYSYYNGPTTIRDKTAYMMIHADIGGIMIWALNHDVEFENEHSLLRTIQNTIDMFS